MKRVALLLIFSIFAGLSAVAQEKPKTDTKPADAKPADAKPTVALPTTDEVIDKWEKAIGGKDAVMKHTSRTMKGTFSIEAMNMTGDIEIFTKAPNKNAVVVAFPNIGNFNQVFDGEKGWSANPMEGLRELSGSELAATKRRADFYADINYKKQYSKMVVTGKEKVGTSDAYVVEATPAEGGPEKLYFDASTGLLLRHDFEADTPQGKMATETYAEDYKVVDGVKLAHTIKQVNPMFAAVMKFTEVKTNVQIDEAKFAKPSAP